MSPGEVRAIMGRRGDAKTVSLGPNRVTFLISGEMTGGKYSMTEFAAAPPPAPAAPIHVHRAEDEAIYVLEGDFQYVIGKRTIPAPPGSYVLVPKDMPHTVANVGSTLGRILVIITPPGFERYWEEMAHLLKVSGGQPDPAQVLGLQEKYNMETGGRPRRFTNP